MDEYWTSKKWSDLSDEPMGLESIKNFHKPYFHFRFNGPRTVKATYSISSTGVEHVVYVLDGLIQIYEDDRLKNNVIVKAGEYACIPKGNRHIRRDGNSTYFTILKMPQKVIEAIESGEIEMPKNVKAFMEADDSE